MYLHHTPHPDDPTQSNEPIEDNTDYNPEIEQMIQDRLDKLYYPSGFPNMESSHLEKSLSS